MELCTITVFGISVCKLMALFYGIPVAAAIIAIIVVALDNWRRKNR